MSKDSYSDGTGDDLDRTRPEGLTGILDALSTAISTARAMPMSSSVLVNRAEMLDLVDQARDALPTQLGRADELLADADSARAAAQAEAEAVLVRARQRASELVDTEVVVVAAHDLRGRLLRPSARRLRDRPRQAAQPGAGRAGEARRSPRWSRRGLTDRAVGPVDARRFGQAGSSAVGLTVGPAGRGVTENLMMGTWKVQRAPHLDPRSPFVLDTHELGRRPGSMRTVQRTVKAPEDLGTVVIGVPPGSDLELDLRLEAVMEGVLVSGSVRGRAIGECIRCLDETVEDGDDEEDVIKPDGDLIDVEPALRDAVVTALPFQPLCRPDCPGLCSECGAHLADDPDHSHEILDPRWAALGGLQSTYDETKES